jgi:hypothetical protein
LGRCLKLYWHRGLVATGSDFYKPEVYSEYRNNSSYREFYWVVKGDNLRPDNPTPQELSVYNERERQRLLTGAKAMATGAIPAIMAGATGMVLASRPSPKVAASAPPGNLANDISPVPRIETTTRSATAAPPAGASSAEIAGPYMELGSKESLASSRAYKQAFSSSEELVIGRLDDTAAGAQLRMRRLNEPDWTINVNDAWVQGGIDGGKPFYLGSNISISNLRSGSPIFPKTVFFRELEQLREANYFRQGNYMLPPPSKNMVTK